MIKVLIADDHPLVRRGIKQTLEATADIVVGGEAANGEEVLQKVRTERWDVVVLDVSMPGRGGLEVLHQVRHEQPRLAVLVLSMHPEDQYAVRVLRAGAAGYMTKESAAGELIAAIRKVHGGGKYVSSALAELLALQLREPTRLPHESLSVREFEVLRGIASGKRVREIATELCLSVKTVSTYRARVLQKMSLQSNAELTRYAIRNGLVE